MKGVAAILAVCGALAALVISRIAYEYACEEREPCSGTSAPVALEVVALIGLAGAIAFLLLAWRASRLAWSILAITAVNYVVWILLFAYVAEGHL